MPDQTDPVFSEQAARHEEIVLDFEAAWSSDAVPPSSPSWREKEPSGFPCWRSWCMLTWSAG